MPFRTNAQLPERVRKFLPKDAQNIFRAAFNSAYEAYGPNSERRAFKTAWAAVKKSYVQPTAGIWMPKHELPVSRRRATRR